MLMTLKVPTKMFPQSMMTSMWKQGTCILALKYNYLLVVSRRWEPQSDVQEMQMVKSLASKTIILFLTHVTWTYQVEFLDGQVGEYNANTIAWNMLSQCNPMGISIPLWNLLLTSKEMVQPSLRAKVLSSIRANDINEKSLKDGISVLNGRMVPPPGKSCPTSRSHTL